MELINKSLLESTAKEMYMYTIPQPRESTSIHDIYLFKYEKKFLSRLFHKSIVYFHANIATSIVNSVLESCFLWGPLHLF